MTPSMTPSPASMPPGLVCERRGGSTRYYYRRRLLASYRQGDPSSHYDRVIALLHDLIRRAHPKLPAPWREANLVWMAVTHLCHNKEATH